MATAMRVHAMDAHVQFRQRPESQQHMRVACAPAGIVVRQCPFFVVPHRLQDSSASVRSRGWKPSSTDRKALHANAGTQRGV